MKGETETPDEPLNESNRYQIILYDKRVKQ